MLIRLPNNEAFVEHSVVVGIYIAKKPPNLADGRILPGWDRGSYVAVELDRRAVVGNSVILCHVPDEMLDEYANQIRDDVNEAWRK